jgi:hypothetical protein
MRTEPYPSWDYLPRNARPPEWVEPFIANVRAAEQSISTVDRKTGLDSDRVLQQLASGLREIGFVVESGKKASERTKRPVLSGLFTMQSVFGDADAPIVVELAQKPDLQGVPGGRARDADRGAAAVPRRLGLRGSTPNGNPSRRSASIMSGSRSTCGAQYARTATPRPRSHAGP